MAWSGLCNRTDEVVGWRDDKSRASLMVGAAERRSAPCFWSTRGKSDIMRRTFAVGCFSVVTEVACAAVTTFFSGGFFFFFFFITVFDSSSVSSTSVVVLFPLVPAVVVFAGRKGLERRFFRNAVNKLGQRVLEFPPQNNNVSVCLIGSI